jgi:hypothetical protein
LYGVDIFTHHNRYGCILIITVFILTFCILVPIPTNARASVSRQISFEMGDLNDYQLTKSKIYTGNETSMIRAQLDEQYGNNDGYLSDAEVDVFKASYDNYLKQSEYVLVDNAKIVKQNASVYLSNMSGNTSDNDTVITQIITFDAHTSNFMEMREHYISFHQELWKYVDLDGSGKFTFDNNVTFTAPSGWRIVYTVGLENISYFEDQRMLNANANSDFEYVTIKISTEVEVDVDDKEGDNDTIPLSMILGAVIIVLIVIIGWAVYHFKAPHKKEKKAVKTDDDHSLTEEEVEKLRDEKNQLREKILKVRRELREEVISKDDARIKEKALKERYKEIIRALKSVEIPE